jgi:hypothetical protein
MFNSYFDITRGYVTFSCQICQARPIRQGTFIFKAWLSRQIALGDLVSRKKHQLKAGGRHALIWSVLVINYSWISYIMCVYIIYI